MKIDFKWIVGFAGSALFGLCTWVLISIVDLKEDTNFIKDKLFEQANYWVLKKQ
jgi:hypothetical protein